MAHKADRRWLALAADWVRSVFSFLTSANLPPGRILKFRRCNGQSYLITDAETDRPLVEAAAALKNLGLSAQDLQKSAKLDAFRQLQQSFAQARTTFREAQQNVRALAAQMTATDAPIKQMQRRSRPLAAF